MIWSRDDRVLIAWDDMRGPSWRNSDEPMFRHYIVYRDGQELDRTYAEAYLDIDVLPARHYRYEVFGTNEANESETEMISCFEVSTTSRPVLDLCSPTPPTGLSADGTPAGILWQWNPSTKLEVTDLLGYIIERDDVGYVGPARAMIWEGSPTVSWEEKVPTGQARCYRARAIDKNLNVSEPSDIVVGVAGSGGWRAYTFTQDMDFTVDSAVRGVDVLLVAGGGAGGGGIMGGGGGAGGFVDVHNLTIRPGVNDGPVVVGQGGSTVEWDNPMDTPELRYAAMGKNSSFGGLVAYGGGYGGRVQGIANYRAANGGSGGGAIPDVQDYWAQPGDYGGNHYVGIPGAAVHNTDEFVLSDAEVVAQGETNPIRCYMIPDIVDVDHPPEADFVISCSNAFDIKFYGASYAFTDTGMADELVDYTALSQPSTYERAFVIPIVDGYNYRIAPVVTNLGPGSCIVSIRATGKGPDMEQGHSGGVGSSWDAWLNHTCGGGGGSQWPANGGWGRNGGLGRPCDIAGKGPYWKYIDWSLVQWYGGGGAGKERPNLWSNPDGQPGYGGGGGCGSPGDLHTGGGGGGGGWLGFGMPNGQAPGPLGGSGVVVIRVPLLYIDKVTAPLQERNEDGSLKVVTVHNVFADADEDIPVYPTGVTVKDLEADETHDDQMGDLDEAVIWAWPYDHFHLLVGVYQN